MPPARWRDGTSVALPFRVSDEAERDTDGERVDPIRTALLALCTTILAIAFFGLLVADQAIAMTF